MGDETERLLGLIGDVQGLLEVDEFRRGLLDALRRAVPSDWVSINEVGPEPGDHWELVEPDLPASAHQVFGRLMHQHPLIARMTSKSRPGSPLRLSDVVSRREFHALDIYKELYGPIGLEYQIAFTLPQDPPRLLGVALSRRRHDFGDADRDLLGRARPFLIQAYRNAVDFDTRHDAGGRGAMTAALREAGLTRREAEMVVLVAHGRSSADAAALLDVGVRTVDKHLQHAFEKLGVRTRSRAAARAWELAERDLLDTGDAARSSVLLGRRTDRGPRLGSIRRPGPRTDPDPERS
jgi:DNA-binding CsgD family transcriptional regulator